MQFDIHVQNLIVPCHIGLLPQEKGTTQRVRFNVTVTLGRETPPATLEDSVPYDQIVHFIEQQASTHVDLVETLAVRIARYCLSYPAAAKAVVRVDKLDIIDPAESVGASVHLARE